MMIIDKRSLKEHKAGIQDETVKTRELGGKVIGFRCHT